MIVKSQQNIIELVTRPVIAAGLPDLFDCVMCWAMAATTPDDALLPELFPMVFPGGVVPPAAATNLGMNGFLIPLPDGVAVGLEGTAEVVTVTESGSLEALL